MIEGIGTQIGQGIFILIREIRLHFKVVHGTLIWETTYKDASEESFIGEKHMRGHGFHGGHIGKLRILSHKIVRNVVPLRQCPMIKRGGGMVTPERCVAQNFCSFRRRGLRANTMRET